jgi:hypothetical protein
MARTLEGLSEFFIDGMLVQSLRLRESPVNRIVTLYTERYQISHRVIPKPTARYQVVDVKVF